MGADLARRLETVVSDVMVASPRTPGAAVAVLLPDGSLHAVALGTADPTTAEPLTPAHAFRIASCTKPFVAATVVSLVNDGRITLDQPVIDLCAPAMADLLTVFEHGRTITVRQVLQHRSGLVDHTRFPEFDQPAQYRWTANEQLTIAVSKPALFDPGTAFSYSDSGYVLLGQVIEHLTGSPLATSVRERLRFDALGLASLHWEIDEPTPDGLVRAHQLLDDHDSHGWHPGFDLFGGGGLVATVGDLARWWTAWFGGSVGDVTTHLAEPAPTTGPAGEHLPFGDRTGLGLFGRTVAGTTVWGHPGFWGLETSHLPDLGVSIAVSLTHRSEGCVGPVTLTDAVVAELLRG